MDENPDDEGLLEFLLTGLAFVADLLASDEEEFTDNDVLKWCLLPARTEMIKKERKSLYSTNIVYSSTSCTTTMHAIWYIFYITYC